MPEYLIIHVQRQRSFVFKHSAILFRASAQSLNNSFSFCATGICLTITVPVDFGSRQLSMVPISKSFHNVVIFLLQ